MAGNIGTKLRELFLQISREFCIRSNGANVDVGPDDGLSKGGQNVEHVAGCGLGEIRDEASNPKIGFFAGGRRHDLPLGTGPAVERRTGIVHAREGPVVAVPRTKVIERLSEFVGVMLDADHIVDGCDSFENPAVVPKGEEINLGVGELFLDGGR